MERLSRINRMLRVTTCLRSSSGQAMVFLISVLIILSFVVIWNFDLHTILHLKSRTQNAGDAAALAAARWQGITLNLIGDLNIMQAIALAGGDTNTAAEISGFQARLAYAGPMVALLAAQQAAKNNGIYVNALFSSRLEEHADTIEDDYPDVFAEPYAGCWEEYAYNLRNICAQGIAAGPDNAHFYYDYDGQHILLELNFYDVVAGRNWCWFYWHAMDLLENYVDYQSWPDLPPIIPETDPSNCEIFGLGILPVETTLPGGSNLIAVLNSLAQDRDLTEETIPESVASITNTWYCYDSSDWTSWDAFSLQGEDPFPAAGPVFPQYDYAGADIAVRITASAASLTPGASASLITWTAAAKPFGYLTAGESDIRPDAYSLVLPAFHNVRLIPVDASSMPEGGAFNLDWREHIEVHLPSYMENGPESLEASCFYCQQLLTWENPDFRQQGIDWLTVTDDEGELIHECIPDEGTRPRRGGTRHGH